MWILGKDLVEGQELLGGKENTLWMDSDIFFALLDVYNTQCFSEGIHEYMPINTPRNAIHPEMQSKTNN